MNAKFLLLVIIVGIVWIDISCSKPQPCRSSRYRIDSLKSIQLFKISSNNELVQLDKDSVKFDSLFFIPSFEEILIASSNNFSLIASASATSPCEPPYTNWKLDSIKIFTLVNNVKTDVTDHFSLNQIKIDYSDQNFLTQLHYITLYLPIHMEFKLITPPIKKDTFQFNFQFFDKEGHMFEKMNNPIVILP